MFKLLYIKLYLMQQLFLMFTNTFRKTRLNKANINQKI